MAPFVDISHHFCSWAPTPQCLGAHVLGCTAAAGNEFFAPVNPRIPTKKKVYIKARPHFLDFDDVTTMNLP